MLGQREPVTHPLIGIARALHGQMVTRLRRNPATRACVRSLRPLPSPSSGSEARPLGLLAQSLAISKQGASQLAGLAEASGYLERVTDGEGGRSKLVGLSARGRRLVDDAIRILRDAESRYVEQIGAARFGRFAEACGTLYVALGVHPRIDAGRSGVDRPALGGLPQLALEIQRRIIAATSALGHRGLKLSQAQILPRIGPAGMRVRDLSSCHGVSRQAVSATCRELESLGYLKREGDPADRRGAILRVTPRGERLLADSIEASRALEREFAAILGRDGLRELRETAHALFLPMREGGRDFMAFPMAATATAGAVHPRRTPAERTKRSARALASPSPQTLGARDAALPSGRSLQTRGEAARATGSARATRRSRA
ncbi:MAG: winged helix-turn-helix transcriptional regulator [Deltaproteobacteria bacterium]|nr:winged helix-turn-helix transcriptional regulator [Deltaproteobacteria bacterium]